MENLVLQCGKQYFLKNSERVTVLRRVANPDYPFVVQTSSGEEQYTADGHFQAFESSPQDILMEAPPIPVAKETVVTKCLARYCTNTTEEMLCKRCYTAIELGKNLPKAGAVEEQEEPPLQETVTLRGGGYEIQLKKIT